MTFLLLVANEFFVRHPPLAWWKCCCMRRRQTSASRWHYDTARLRMELGKARAPTGIFAGVPDGIRLTVRDDGIGFDPADERNRGGLGLLSMNERLRLVGGRIAIDSVPSNGTTVKAWVAIDAAEASRNTFPGEGATIVYEATRRESDEPHTGTFG